MTCPTCEFSLWHEIWADETVRVGVYNDARFPGRLLVMLNGHYEHLDEVPFDLASTFLNECQRISKALRYELGVDRINFAVLGNEVPHVHAHLIPRRPSDSCPSKAPWEDVREKGELHGGEWARLKIRLRGAIESAFTG